MTKCPTCFWALPAVPERYICIGGCPPNPHALASSARGYEVVRPPVLDARGDNGVPAYCTKCNEGSNQEVCPTCLGDVPADWRGAKVTCLALAGARATGKSLLLAVVKEQLEILAERHYRSALRPLGGTEQRFYDAYTQPLYEHRRILEPTVPIAYDQTTSRDPLMFEFREVAADGSKRRRILVMRDVAGEDLENLQGDNTSLSFFSRADAVIALLDPLKVPAVRQMLADLVPGDARLGGDGVNVVTNLLALMSRGSPTGMTNVPIGVVLSKFDTLQQLRAVRGTEWSRIMNRPGSPLQRDPSMQSARFDPDDADLLHFEVRALLSKLKSDRLTAVIEESAQNYRYFAVSALGASPQGEMLHAGGIAPFRVLDPFKWALA